jgi:hypothetical protein
MVRSFVFGSVVDSEGNVREATGADDDDSSSENSDSLPGSISAWRVVNHKKKKRKEISPIASDCIRKQNKRESKRVRKSAEQYQHIP